MTIAHTLIRACYVRDIPPPTSAWEEEVAAHPAMHQRYRRLLNDVEDRCRATLTRQGVK